MKDQTLDQTLDAIKAAPFLRRLSAHLVDFVLTNGCELAIEYVGVSVVYLVRRYLLGQTLDFDHAVSAIVQQGFGLILGLFILYYYYVVFQVKHGNTLGKKWMKIRVVHSVTLQPMSAQQAQKRLLAYFPSYLILGCGFLMAAFNKKGLALHDSLTKTRVIDLRP